MAKVSHIRRLHNRNKWGFCNGPGLFCCTNHNNLGLTATLEVPNFVSGKQKLFDTMKKALTWWSVLGMGLLYMLFVFAACFFGFFGPVCWAIFPVVAALLGSGTYFWLAARWQKFGVGTYTALLVCIFCLVTGEATGFLSKAIIVAGGLLADVVRLLVGNTSKKSLYFAYPFLAVGNIGWIVNLWTRPEWYIDGAVEEMGQAYADGIAKLQNPGFLCLCIVLTAAVAVLSIWLCGKVDKKSAKLLN